MKIAQVTLRFDAPGGVETTVRQLARGLRQLGEQVNVYASDLYDEAHWERRSDYPATVEGIPVFRFPVYKRLIPGLTLPLMPGLMDALAASGADVIHAHSHRYGHVLQSGAVAKATRIPLVVSTHYHPADRREPGWKRSFLRLQDIVFGASVYRIADTLIVETELEAALLREFAPAGKIRVIPPGIDLAAWTPGSDRALPPEVNGVAIPHRFLLYAGRIASNKGLPNLFAALARMEPERRIPLVLMGRDWGERGVLESLANSLGIERDVLWLGYVNDPAVYRGVVRKAAILVLPSEWEAFGLVILEAFAAGTPVVATEVGGVPEVLDRGRCGALVPYGDVSKLADTLLGMTSEPGIARRFSDEGRKRVEEFTLDRMIGRHRALYQGLTQSRSS